MTLYVLNLKREREPPGQVIQAEWLPGLWLKRHKMVDVDLTNAIMILLLLITIKEVDVCLVWVPAHGCVTESTERLNEALHPFPLDPISWLWSAINGPL